MRKIALVTDSTCDMTDADRQRYVTAVVPLHVSLRGTSYLDRMDFDPGAFYRMFREAGQAAQSSQPSVGEFADVYRTLLDRHDAVLSVHISGQLSGTVETAEIAAGSVDPARVQVVDSRHVSIGTGLVVGAAGKAILAGADLTEAVAAAQAAATQTRVYGAVPSLEVAVRGGRLSARSARLAGLIDLKPIIVFDERGAAGVDGVRLGYYRALRAVTELTARHAGGNPAEFAVVHANGLQAAGYVHRRLQQLTGVQQIPIVEAGAVITTHVGLGTVAVAVRRDGPPQSGSTDSGAVA